MLPTAYRRKSALAESESRYRTLFNSIDEGFCIIEAIPAADGKPGDYRYIAANPALKAQSGVTVNVGHDTIRGLLSTEAQSWIDVFDEILRTGQPVRGERGLLTQGGCWIFIRSGWKTRRNAASA